MVGLGILIVLGVVAFLAFVVWGCIVDPITPADIFRLAGIEDDPEPEPELDMETRPWWEDDPDAEPETSPWWEDDPDAD